jgi:hypothetical protein
MIEIDAVCTIARVSVSKIESDRDDVHAGLGRLVAHMPSVHESLISLVCSVSMCVCLRMWHAHSAHKFHELINKL